MALLKQLSLLPIDFFLPFNGIQNFSLTDIGLTVGSSKLSYVPRGGPGHERS
jgi:hypothetical protein